MPHSVVEVNDTPDDVLQPVIMATVADPEATVDPIFPFITAGIMSRINKALPKARDENQANQANQANQTRGWCKQALLAKVIANMTGTRLQKADAEYIGNLQSRFIRDHDISMKKAKAAAQVAACKARKAGRPVPACHAERVLELERRVYHCKYGGVPRAVVVEDAAQPPSNAACIHKQRVPYRRVHDTQEVNVKLQAEIAELKREPDAARIFERECARSRMVAEREERARKTVEERCAAMCEAEQRAAEEAKDRARLANDRARSVKEMLREAEHSLLKAQGELRKLGSQVAAAHVQAGRAMQQQEKYREKYTEMLRVERQLAQDELAHACAAAKGEMEKAKEEKLASERECKRAKGQVLRLGAQVAAAHVEVERAIQREEQAKVNALLMAAAQCEEAESDRAFAADQLEKLRREKAVADQECRRAKGQVEKLGSQVVLAHVEVERAMLREQNAKDMLASARQEAQERTDEVQHLRELKARMAKRARDAVRRAARSDFLEKQLTHTRERLRTAQKEVTNARVRKHLDCESDTLDSERGSSLGSDSESFENLRDNDPPFEDSTEVDFHPVQETREPEAAKLISSMPQWRAIRGKGAGKGAAKLEWGTRLVIYTLLALMVPASAIGMAIVIVVKRTAPWLNPTAPTTETVQRCRFELRFVEEALAARRVAGAYRVRAIGFDETTKLGNCSLTSNVTIEPTEGAKLEDVILRAAYCPLGGTSELCVKSIEDRCFARLRWRLNRWREMFERMFPGEQWTGPEGALLYVP